MKTEGQTSKYLLLASIVSVFSMMLALITAAMSWELWMILLIMAGMFCVWFLHIGKMGSQAHYENLCAGVMMVEFFFFGAHRESFFDLPAVVCLMVLVFSMLDRKMLVYMTVALYTLQILYHISVLHTFSGEISGQEALRMGIGIMVVAGAAAIARYRINRRLEARKRYEKVAEQLEIMGRQNADFLSNVSHELRTPINMVIGISEVAFEKAMSPEVRKDIQSIQMAGKRLSSQINNILDYTEIVEGTLIPAKEEYMITSVLNDVITMSAVQSGRQQLEIVFDMDLKMPAVLVGDAEKLSHVLKILLENSIKFTEEGGINVCVEFRRESYGGNLVIDVYDTGIGMTDTQITQIYDEFYQADTGSGRFSSGLGLGIPIARGLLHAMGGFIYFESKGQNGLHAHITLPQGVADDTPCMSVADANKLCIACYFRPEKYSSDEIREYYDRLIYHLMEGLGIEGYQAHNFNGLLKLQHMYKLTHIFIAQAEYEENRTYYEELADTLRVVVIAERDYVLSRNSKLLMIRKPFFALSVVNLLNGEVQENGFEEAQNAGRKPFSCTGVRVLAVDDEEMNLVVAKGVLGSYGIDVSTCLSGKEAIELCTENQYDIIFLDHMMPGFDGVETLRRIRTINGGMYQNLPVIALTANTISGAREMFRDEGFSEFIPKPIERATLERVLRRVLPKKCIQYKEEPVAEDAILEQPEGSMGCEVALELPERAAGCEAALGMPEGATGCEVALATPEGSMGCEAALEMPEGSTGCEVALGMPEEPAGFDGAPKTAGQAAGEDLFGGLSEVGVDLKVGLDYCCGDENFFLEMLRMYYGQSAEKREELISLYEAGNWADYAVKVHALKSTSLTIGAVELSERAKALELAGKKEDEAFIRGNHEELLRMHEALCEKIAGL